MCTMLGCRSRICLDSDMAKDADISGDLQDAVVRALQAGESLRICGSGSKGFLLSSNNGGETSVSSRLLSVHEHAGILSYRPEELVITARAGTRLSDIEQVLARHYQRLPFEPPRIKGAGTLGGAVASGLAGPGRPWSGSVRDSVLGVEMLNGLGERLIFGGQVMKNVAGYDVSRLQVGAFGTLGVLLSVSVRVLPVPPTERTVVQAVGPAEALARCRTWARSAYPISATAYLDGLLRVRLAGAEAAVSDATQALGGDPRDESIFWRQLRDHDLDFFQQEQPVWRCALPPAASAPLQDCLIVWGGGLRWWRTSLDPLEVRKTVGEQQGSAQIFDGGFGRCRLAGVGSAQATYQQRIREAFDPHGLFNPELTRRRAD